MFEVPRKESNWKFITSPALIGNKFNGIYALILLISLFLSLITTVVFFFYIGLFIVALELLRIKYNYRSIKEMAYAQIQKFSKTKQAIIKRHTNYLPVLLVLLIMPFTPKAEAGLEVIFSNSTAGDKMHKKSAIKSTSSNYFVDNKKKIRGAGPNVTLPAFLDSILPGGYTVRYKSPELQGMSIDWMSKGWTVDQLLGNVSKRYGIQFELTRGSSVIYVAWLDAKKCSEMKEETLLKLICGDAGGFHLN